MLESVDDECDFVVGGRRVAGWMSFHSSNVSFTWRNSLHEQITVSATFAESDSV